MLRYKSDTLCSFNFIQADGSCECGPGYRGLMCESRCSAGSWGPGCGGECECGPGRECHPVTGDCVPCTEGSWGAGCAEACLCHQEGTALCSHLDGRCFCEGNFFGDKCDLHCPFGYNKKLGCLEKFDVRFTWTSYEDGCFYLRTRAAAVRLTCGGVSPVRAACVPRVKIAASRPQI